MRIRTLSSVEAQRKTTFARAPSVLPVRVSTNSTPVARLPSRSTSTRATTASLRTVSRPVSSAARSVVAVLEMRECAWPGSGGRPANSPREMMTRRSGKTRSTRSLNTRSAGVIGRGSRNSPSGSCGKPSREPCTPRKRSSSA